MLRLIFLLLATPAVLKAQTLELTTSPGMGFEAALKLSQRANTAAAYPEAVNELQQINPQTFHQKIRKMLSAAG